MFVALREQRGLGWRGFGDVDTRTIGAWTGLPPEQAVLAQARDFDEPFLWEPEPSPTLVAEVDAALAAAGLRLTRGGRFWHLTGVNDKGRAVRWLLHALTTCWGEEPRSLGLGDSENDLPMLEAVGRGIFVERPGRGHLVPRPEGIDVVKGVGPVGWNRAVLEWLENIRS